jgi:chorismate synthase
LGEGVRLTTAGESHGPSVTAIVEGIPAGLAVAAAEIDRELARRQVGYGRGGRMRIEKDRVQIKAGIRHGKTLGHPIWLVVENRDWANWQEEMSAASPEAGWRSDRAVTVPRPGHADLAGAAKFDHRDMRNVLERASARETAARVAVGAVCKRLLSEVGIEVRGQTLAIGGVEASQTARGETAWDRVEASDLRCADEEAAAKMRARIDQACQEGDSLGGVFEVVGMGVPPGLGSYASWEQRLDGRLAQAVLSIPGIKAAEIGMGFRGAALPGSRVHDPISRRPDAGKHEWPFARGSNNAGGLEGGVTNGEPVVMRAAMKPIPTLMRPLASVDLGSHQPAEAHAERSDVCAVPAACVVAEAMMALVLASALREKLGGDTVQDLKAAHQAYMRRLWAL